jgi:uncharacterized protein YjbI with pentapeptide repeats
MFSPRTDLQTDIVITSTDLDAANQFLDSSIDRRWRWLETLGLVRYAKLFTQMQPTGANIACVAQFLSYPSSVKFPQLMGTDLAGLDLERVNFIRANLTGANLSGCNFRDADLLFANFSRANLSGADLCGATLNETMWQGSIVSSCDFRESIGLTSVQMRDLRSTGGIFE